MFALVSRIAGEDSIRIIKPRPRGTGARRGYSRHGSMSSEQKSIEIIEKISSP